MIPNHPAIVGTVADAPTLTCLPTLGQTIDCCDLLEFRIDGLLSEQHALQERLTSSPKPVLLTVRDPAEGGMGALSIEERAAHLESYLPHAQIVDIEIRNLAKFTPIVSQAKGANVAILASYHDFTTTPTAETLREAGSRAIDAGADLLKFAVTTRTANDVHTLHHLLEAFRPSIPTAAMGMGPLGMSSRVLLAQAGSILNYAYLQQANAPGQWSAHEMRSLFTAMAL